MLGYAARNVRAAKRRLLGTAAAITLGVALIAGTFVSTDTISQVVGEATAGPSRPVDVVVVDRRSPLTGSVVDDIFGIPWLLEAGHLTPLPARLAGELRSVEGVASATGVTMAPVELIGPGGHVVTGQGAPIARSVDDTFSPFVASGRLPTGPDDVILDHSTATSENLDVGDPVDVVLPEGRIQGFTLVGTVDGAELVGNLLVGLAPSTATRLLADTGEYSLIELRAEQGVDGEELLPVITSRLADHQGAITGTALRGWGQAEATQFTGLLRWVISIAGLVALLLGSFVIRNTFTIVLAARARELALLRCIGATRGQIHRLVLTEAALIGLVASAAGLAVGVALASILGLLVDADDVVAVTVSGATPIVTPRTVVAALAVGTGSAVVSALGAARRATRIAPVAALREEVHSVPRREGRVRTVVGFALIVAGSAAILGAQAAGVGPEPMLPGAIALIGGIVAAGPMLARAFAAIIGAPLAKLFGVTGDLARTNSQRNPRRTSATILPLAIGLALIIAFATFVSSVKTPMTDDFNTAWRADLRITRTASQSQLPVGNQLRPDVVDRIKETGAFTTVVALQTSADYTIAGQQTSVTGVAAAQLPSVMEVTVVAGSLHEIHPGAIAISTEVANEQQARIGNSLDIETPKGRTWFVVGAIYERPTFSAAGQQYDLADELPYGDLLVSPTDYQRTTGRTGIDTILASAGDGVTPTAAQQAADLALHDYPPVQISSRADMLRQLFDGDAAVRFYYGLLGLITIIAFLGIANTLALSITERRREIGLLRAIGLDRRQTRATIRLEAAITAIAATAIALTLGVLLGQIFTQMQELPYQPPARQLVVIATASIGIVIGVASRPARHASRLPTLTALATE
jgi:putative ABC transport system permease protein